MNTILAIITSPFASGAEYSLFEYIEQANAAQYVVAIPKKNILNLKIPKKCKVVRLPLLWYSNTYNPLYLFIIFINLIYVTFKLIYIIKKHKINIIYSNNIKSYIYVLLIRLVFPGLKNVCHVRDNCKKDLLHRLIYKSLDNTICISRYIYNQISVKSNRYMVYGGIDSEKWKKDENFMVKRNTISTLTSNSLFVACIGQLTRWKNQIDFISAARIILARYDNVNFFIIGEDLSGREKKYKNELLKNINGNGIQKRIQFLGHREDIKEILNQIDILVHPAINEPFGRVLIEAMAMEKPIIAYNCGGPPEIIVNGETGFLIEPYNCQQLAEKTMELINSRELRRTMGKAGRKHVIEKFNIKRYTREMEEVFNNLQSKFEAQC